MILSTISMDNIMTSDIDTNQINEEIYQDLEAGRYSKATNLFLELRPADQAEVFNNLDDANQELLLNQLDIPSTADLFDELEDEDTLEAAENLSIERLADILDEMDPDEAADLLGDLPPEQAEEALAQMDDPEDVIPLLEYPDETAGGRMTTAFVALHLKTTSESAIQILRDVGIENDVPYYLFIVDKDNHLEGVAGLRDLVISRPQTILDDIMDPDVISIPAEADQEEAARIMTKYDLSALPVINYENQLVGVISHDDILDVLEDEATEDIYRLSNLTDSDLEPESTTGQQLKGRLPWLILNSITSLVAAWVISNFGDLYVQVAMLAFFQSIVAGLGGSAASQDVVMIVRALALEKITTRQALPILFRQVWVGLLQGAILGVLIGIGVGIWQGNPFFGLVLGLALIGNMIVAATVGTLIPLLLKSLNQDPALSSSVLVTAATDALGFLIYLSLASLFLPYIQRYIAF
jgi:magnesium transporter